MHPARTEEGDESATDTSTGSDSESDDWSDTEEEDEEQEDVRHRGSNDSDAADTTAMAPCMSVTCSNTFALILKFCAGSEIAGRFSSGALALSMAM